MSTKLSKGKISSYKNELAALKRGESTLSETRLPVEDIEYIIQKVSGHTNVAMSRYVAPVSLNVQKTELVVGKPFKKSDNLSEIPDDTLFVFEVSKDPNQIIESYDSSRKELLLMVQKLIAEYEDAISDQRKPEVSSLDFGLD